MGKTKGGRGGKEKNDEEEKKEVIVDLADYRKNKNEERMREYERILFNRILGVYSFAEKTGLHHVEVVDISYKGLMFREINPESVCAIGDKIALRFYFTPSSYLRLILEVKRLIPFKDDERDGVEYGCEVDKKTRSYEVIHTLVDFMHKYSEVAVQDNNPPMIWF